MSSLFGIAANGASEFYPEKINQSLRFDGNAKLLRTPSSDGDRKKWTTSFWVKRAKLTTLQYLWSGASYSGNDGIAAIYFNADDKIHTYFDTSGSNPYGNVNNRVYRDTTNWYHIVWAVDAVNTVQRIWVNGVEETLSSSLNPPNYAYGMNKAGTSQGFGVATWGGSPNLQAYLANIVHLDGQYLDESYFGETKNGVWIPKEISGLTFGTNGFHLDFANSGSVGNDISGNNNDYTPTGFASTDVVPDSPTNNFATFNILTGHSATTMSEGNLRALANNSSNILESQSSTIGVTSGKWYAEFRADDLVNDTQNNGTQIGVTTVPYDRGSGNQNGYIVGNTRVNLDQSSGAYLGVDQNISTTIGSYADGDIIGVALNADDSEVSFYKNGSAITNAQDASITNVNGVYFFEIQVRKYDGDTSQITANFGQDSTFVGAVSAGGNTDSRGRGDFKYSVPSGYLALCTANLPDTTLSPNQAEQADDYFNTVLYTGNGSTQSITGVGFAPDWVWIKERSSTSSHAIGDTSRGALKVLQIDVGTAEVSTSTNFTSFDTDGFSHGNSGRVNQGSQTYVAWNWKINGGTTSSNTEGSLTCTTQANTKAGISIVTWAGDGNTSVTLGHGLESKPELIIYKGRDNNFEWPTWYKTFGTTTGSFISTNNQPGTFARVTSEPTSTVIPNAEKNYTNVSSENNIAYVFHSVDGFSKISQYTGNGLTDGTFVHTGFRPAWVMIKKTSGSGNWCIFDNKQNPDNAVNLMLLADTNGDNSAGGTGDNLDFLSNGFKLRDTSSGRNGSSATYIYMAFAEQPFKFSNAR